MKAFYLYISVICAAAVLLFMPTDALAVKIRNLDDAPRTVTVSGSGWSKTVTIAPSDSYYTFSPGVRLDITGQKTIVTHGNPEYIIQKGRLYVQRHDITYFR